MRFPPTLARTTRHPGALLALSIAACSARDTAPSARPTEAPRPAGAEVDGGRAIADADGGVRSDAGVAALVFDPNGSPVPPTRPLEPGEAVTVTVFADSPRYELAPEFAGQNFVGFPGWGADVSFSAFQKSALHAAGISALRYPGGAPAEWSDLGFTGTCQDGAPANWGAPPYQMLWDELAAGGLMQLVLQTNPTPQWCGSGAQDSSGTHAAALAAEATARGIATAFEVGNEPDLGDSYFASHGGEAAYVSKFIEHADAIHAAAPGARMFGPAVCGLGGNCSVPVTWDTGWIARFLAATGDRATGPGRGRVDGVSFHVYLHSEWGYSDLAEAGTDPYGFASYWPWRLMPYLRAQIATYDSRPLPIMISEVNVGTANDPNGNGNVSAFLRTLDLVAAFAFAGVHAFQWFDANQPGPSDYAMVSATAARPPFYAFAAWVRMGRLVMNQETSASAHDLAVVATAQPNGSLQTLLVNKTASAHAVTIAFRGAHVGGRAAALHTFVSPDGTDLAPDVVVNGAASPAPGSLPPGVPLTLGAELVVTVPAYGALVVEVAPPR